MKTDFMRVKWWPVLKAHSIIFAQHEVRQALCHHLPTKWTKHYESPHKIKQRPSLFCSDKSLCIRQIESHEEKHLLLLFDIFDQIFCWYLIISFLCVDYRRTTLLYIIYSLLNSSNLAFFAIASQPDINSSLIDPTLRLLTGSRHMVM